VVNLKPYYTSKPTLMGSVFYFNKDYKTIKGPYEGPFKSTVNILTA